MCLMHLHFPSNSGETAVLRQQKCTDYLNVAKPYGTDFLYSTWKDDQVLHVVSSWSQEEDEGGEKPMQAGCLLNARSQISHADLLHHY